MPRWPWHMTRRGYPDDPEAAVGLYSSFGAMRGAYAPDFADHTRGKATVWEPSGPSSDARAEPRD